MNKEINNKLEEMGKKLLNHYLEVNIEVKIFNNKDELVKTIRFPYVGHLKAHYHE